MPLYNTEKNSSFVDVFWKKIYKLFYKNKTEIVNEQVIYKWEKGTTYGENFRRLCLKFYLSICNAQS